ncbi:MAG: HD domain-containing protein [Ardenticatenaceae bacterium]|nr:HD domain-containing protein [Ardenticatenaceae bacterium]
MKKATEKEALARYGSQTPPFNYRWEHVRAVVTLAVKLAELTGADREVVEAAAWLHDVRKETGDAHAKEGAKFARTFLKGTDFPPEKIAAVSRAIGAHTGLWRGKPFPKKPLSSLESAVLWDADKLAKIGLTAAFHWLGLSFAKGISQETKDFIENGRKADWQAKTVASMHTEPARRAALARFHAYYQLWDTLEAELNGDDLIPFEVH